MTPEKPLTLALAGNPNCGKTVIFNGLTGGNQRVGNWPGVTVEKKEGLLKFDSDQTAHVVDLPGIYGLSASSDDERVSRDYILGGEPNLIVNILDGSNIERNLYLTLQLLEMGLPVVVVINMMDIAENKGIKIDAKSLSQQLGVPVIPVKALEKAGIDAIKDLIQASLKDLKPAKLLLNYPDAMEGLVKEWTPLFGSWAKDLKVTPRWLILQIIEKEPYLSEAVVKMGLVSSEQLKAKEGELKKEINEDFDIVTADIKYQFIEDCVKKSVKKIQQKESMTEKIDKIVMNRFLGLPIFLVAMYLVFWVTITVGGAFIDFFDGFFGTLFVDGFGSLLTGIGTPEWLVVILAKGIGGGLQTVSTFIPIIFTMFFMLSLLEDSGYMSRAAFVMDRLMRKLGLPGKAFVPMLLGFGCTIPAIMATRTLETKKDKFTTIFMAPFMSCGARLPVYALFAAALFPANGGLIVFSIYMAGILLAVLTGLLLKNTVFKGQNTPFVMELPTYHAPRMTQIMSFTGSKLKAFVMRAGLVITSVVLVLSFLNTVGVDKNGWSFGNDDTEKSLLAHIGKTVTPIFQPMGISQENWPATVGLFTGLFAKEAIVGTVNSLYSAQSEAAQAAAGTAPEPEKFYFWKGIGAAFKTIPDNLSGVLGGLLDPIGLNVITSDEAEAAKNLEAEPGTFQIMRNLFTPYSAYAYMLFILIYFPCVAALGTAIQEMGGRLGAFLATYLTLLAWCISTLFYQISYAHSFWWISASAVLLVGIVFVLTLVGKKTAGLIQAKSVGTA